MADAMSDLHPNLPKTPEERPTLRETLKQVQATLETGAKIPTQEEDAATTASCGAELNPNEISQVMDPLPPRKAPVMHITPMPAEPGENGNKVDRETRVLLRQVQAHLLNAHLWLGAEHQTLDLVEVLYHPASSLGSLNYVTPRQKTAWISSDQLQHGIDFLTKHDRTPRILYIEGLLPPLFARTLDQLGLVVENEVPVMVYSSEPFHGEPPAPILAPQLPEDLRIQVVTDLSTVEIWWYVWQNALYDVLTMGVEPLYVGRELAAVKMGKQIDLLLYAHQSFPMGAARVTLYEESAHIVGVALFRELCTPERTKLLFQAAAYQAIKQGAKLVFAPGETPADRDLARQLGFMDFGSVLSYAAKSETPKAHAPDSLAQPILDLRHRE